jgi:hypothetical protein
MEVTLRLALVDFAEYQMAVLRNILQHFVIGAVSAPTLIIKKSRRGCKSERKFSHNAAHQRSLQTSDS